MRACVCACALAAVCAATCELGAGAFVGAPRPRAKARQGERLDIRLRSLTTRATGRLVVEPSESGGRALLTALGLPDPQTLASTARTYVVWALSGGRIVRLGELVRDERGNGGLAFDRPGGFERYGVIVTAEPSADVERPGDPVLTTRTDEAAALYPAKTGDAAAAGDSARAPKATTGPAPRPPDPAPPASRTRRAGVAGDFYTEVDDALASRGGGRLIELDGSSAAPGASGAARATLLTGRAYVRVNFRGLPLPDSVGANVYVMWAVTPEGRIAYMGSLPVTEAINTAEIYVRAAGFEADDYTLHVTAERQRPVPAPSGRLMLAPKSATIVK